MKTRSTDELIPAYVLGTLEDDERRAFDDELARSARLRREVDTMVEALASAAADAVATRAPAAPASVRGRLLATLAGVDRFAPFLTDLTRLFELPIETMRALLARIDEPGEGWERRLGRMALETSELFHFPVGPTLAAGGAAGGVLRVRAGGAFPAHHHDGDETTYVLEGACITDGHTCGPGSVIEMKRGSGHSFSAAPERDLVVMVLHRGITFG